MQLWPGPSWSAPGPNSSQPQPECGSESSPQHRGTSHEDGPTNQPAGSHKLSTLVLAQPTGRESFFFFFLFYLTAALNSRVVTKTELKDETAFRVAVMNGQ